METTPRRKKSAEQRVAEHRARADAIEVRERQRVLRASPQWMATRQAIERIDAAMRYIVLQSEDGSPRDTEHEQVLSACLVALLQLRRARFGDDAGTR